VTLPDHCSNNALVYLSLRPKS